jgi:hypothetical protein
VEVYLYTHVGLEGVVLRGHVILSGPAGRQAVPSYAEAIYKLGTNILRDR